MAMSGAPTSTVSPVAARSSTTVPANGLGSSTTAFSVSTSTSTWFSVTSSPGGNVPGNHLGVGQPLPEVGQKELADTHPCRHRSTSWRIRSASGR